MTFLSYLFGIIAIILVTLGAAYAAHLRSLNEYLREQNRSLDKQNLHLAFEFERASKELVATKSALRSAHINMDMMLNEDRHEYSLFALKKKHQLYTKL